MGLPRMIMRVNFNIHATKADKRFVDIGPDLEYYKKQRGRTFGMPIMMPSSL